MGSFLGIDSYNICIIAKMSLVIGATNFVSYFKIQSV